MDPVKEIKEKLDIVELVRSYIPLQPAGKNLKGLCPFHKEKTPSFIVSPDRQTWHCFGQCNEGGDIFSFVMKYENVEFYEALRMLAEKAGIELKSVSPASQKEFGVLYDINVSAKDFFVHERGQNKNAQQYLLDRGIQEETMETFEIGFCPNSPDALSMHLANMGYDMHDIERAGLVFKTQQGTFIDRFRGRVMFPIYNTFGKVVGFSGRILPEFDTHNAGKYINSPETLIFNKSKILYGFHITKSAMKEKDEIIVVEGQMDFLMAYQDGVPNVVATSGTALTAYHLEILKKFSENIIFAFDNDEAGIHATERAIDMANMLDINARVFLLDQEKDAAEYIQKHPKTLASLIRQKTLSAFDFYIKKYLADISGENVKQKMRYMLSKIQLLQSPIEKTRWIKELSQKFDVPERALLEELEMLSKKQPIPKDSSQKVAPEQPTQSLSTRLERLADQICSLSFLVEDVGLYLAPYQAYFPESFEHIVASLISGDKSALSKQDLETLEYAEARASLGHPRISDAHMASLELSFLLKELKREFIRQKRDSLRHVIADLEQQGKHDQMQNALKEFDELTHLIDNT